LLRSAQYADLTVDSTTGYAALAEPLRRVDAAGGIGWSDDRSPFPGLRPFDVEQHQVFFGRAGETEELSELLRSPAEQAKAAMLLVVGPSGCGKSSLVRAGLLHAMAEEPGWLTLPPILPGADPVAAMARALAAAARQSNLDWTVEHVYHVLDKHGLVGCADELLLAHPDGPLRRLLLVVDQCEELLTQTGPANRARFAQLLRPALSGPVQVVATLRPESLAQLLTNSDLATVPTHTYELRPLHREALRVVIEGPAELAGIGVDAELVARLVADTDSGEALPLLAFTLAQLANGVHRGERLDQHRYDEIGGVQGALTRQADAALADAITTSGRRREEVIAGLLRLVTVDEQGRPTRWRVPKVQLPEPVAREVDVFVTRRLVTIDTDNGSVVVGVAHEAFLSGWPPLAQAINENAIALRARRAVEQAATGWNDHSRTPDRLWERDHLAAAVADTGVRYRRAPPQAASSATRGPLRWWARRNSVLASDRVELSPTARDFLHASIRRDRFRRQRAVTVLSVLLALALAAFVLAVIQRRAAERQRDVAVSRQVAGQALELRATNPALAAQLSLAAYQLVPTTEARGSLLSIAADPYTTRLTGHTTGLTRVAFSPDGRTLATASVDTTVRLWDISNPRQPHPLSTLTDHTAEVWSVAFSPDGRTLATGSDDGIARLWDISDPRQPHPLSTLTGHTKTVRGVAFSPDGRTLATASDDTTARLWDISDPRQAHPLSTLTGHTDTIWSVAFSPDGRTLATASDDTTARLWDISDPRQPHPLSTLTGHTADVLSVVFSPDGHTLATASRDTTARLWDISDPSQPHLLSTFTGHTADVLSVGFSPDGHTLATASLDTTVRLWDISDPRQPHPLSTLTGHTSMVWSVVFSPDGQTLATASADNTARLWDLPGPIRVGHTGTVRALAFSRDGHTLATGSNDHTARLWDVRDPYHPHPLATLTGHTNNIYSVAFSPDGHTLATGSYDHTARLWDVRDPSQPHLLGTVTGHTDAIWSVAFSPDGHTLATAGDDDTARLWDISDARQPSPLSTLTVPGAGVFSVAFSPDGHTLATGSNDHTARLWDIHDPRQPHLLSRLTGHTNDVYSVAFSPDGHTLATGSDDTTARLWDVHDPRQPHLLSTLTGHTNAIWSVAFSSDGHTLATGSVDTTARSWDVHDPRQPHLLSTLTGHTNTVRAVAFGPDGHTLATASDDTTARLWDTNIENVATRICAITRPAITNSEWGQYLPDLPYRPPCP
jgi:WD40 repeat protein/energy-coupling factor transporter ATP-binding protein EcfA2